MGVKQAVQNRFGAAAPEYATSATHVGGPDLDAMRAASGLGPGCRPGRLLDVGTGAGHTAFAFSPLISQVEALDLTQEMLDEVARGARQRGLDNIHCQLGDAETLPYPDAAFDFVASRLCAHHFEDVPAFLSEVARVLKPGACFLLVDSLAPENAAADAFFNEFELLRDPCHVRNYARSGWQRMLAAAGFHSEVLGEVFMLRQEFDAWVTRIGTPTPAIAQLRSLFENAPEALRREFEIVTAAQGVPSLSIPSGLVRAQLR